MPDGHIDGVEDRVPVLIAVLHADVQRKLGQEHRTHTHNDIAAGANTDRAGEWNHGNLDDPDFQLDSGEWSESVLADSVYERHRPADGPEREQLPRLREYRAVGSHGPGQLHGRQHVPVRWHIEGFDRGYDVLLEDTGQQLEWDRWQLLEPAELHDGWQHGELLGNGDRRIDRSRDHWGERFVGKLQRDDHVGWIFV